MHLINLRGSDSGSHRRVLEKQQSRFGRARSTGVILIIRRATDEFHRFHCNIRVKRWQIFSERTLWTCLSEEDGRLRGRPTIPLRN